MKFNQPTVDAFTGRKPSAVSHQDARQLARCGQRPRSPSPQAFSSNPGSGFNPFQSPAVLPSLGASSQPVVPSCPFGFTRLPLRDSRQTPVPVIAGSSTAFQFGSSSAIFPPSPFSYGVTNIGSPSFGSPLPSHGARDSTSSQATFYQGGDNMEVDAVELPFGTRSEADIVSIGELVLSDNVSKRPAKMDRKLFRTVGLCTFFEEEESDEFGVMDYAIQIHGKSYGGRYKTKSLVPWTESGKDFIAKRLAVFIELERLKAESGKWFSHSIIKAKYSKIQDFLTNTFVTNVRGLFKDPYFVERVDLYVNQFEIAHGKQGDGDKELWSREFDEIAEAISEPNGNTNRSNDRVETRVDTLIKNGHEKDILQLKKDVLDKKTNLIKEKKEAMMIKAIIGKRSRSDVESDDDVLSDDDESIVSDDDEKGDRPGKKRKQC